MQCDLDRWMTASTMLPIDSIVHVMEQYCCMLPTASYRYNLFSRRTPPHLPPKGLICRSSKNLLSAEHCCMGSRRSCISKRNVDVTTQITCVCFRVQIQDFDNIFGRLRRNSTTSNFEPPPIRLEALERGKIWGSFLLYRIQHLRGQDLFCSPH